MGVGNRPSACAHCGKRLTYKSWYYRNGKHFCTRRCWNAAEEKAASASAEAAEASKTAGAPTASEAPNVADAPT